MTINLFFIQWKEYVLTSSSVRAQPFDAPMLSSSCLSDVAPIITEVTTDFCINQRSATCGMDLPGE